MLRRWWLAAAALLAAGSAHAQGLAVKLDVEAARQVLAAVRDPRLTRERALAIAKLPGNQGLIEKAHSYKKPADDALLAEALLAAAQHRASDADVYFHFADVRDAADKIAPVIEALAAPGALDPVRARIAQFTPARVQASVTGYLVVGGTSGGFAFGDPQFYLNLARYPSAALAKTILAHELYHAVQAAADAARPVSAEAKACLAKIPASEDLGQLYWSLRAEGTASYVGDVLGLPADDPAAKPERERAQRGINLIARSVTLLGLSTHSLVSKGPVSYDDIYGLGFYGDEILYSLGYVMTRAIAAEQGPGAVAELIDQPGAAMILRYAGLKAYGSKDAPALDPETLDAAKRLMACYPG